MTTVVLDADGVTSLADPANRHRYRALLNATHGVPVVPSAVLAETATGTHRDANLNRFLKGVTVTAIDKTIGLEAGRLRAHVLAGVAPGARARRRSPSGIDALVVAVADKAAGRDEVVVLTSDPRDLLALAMFTSNPVAVEAT